MLPGCQQPNLLLDPECIYPVLHLSQIENKHCTDFSMYTSGLPSQLQAKSIMLRKYQISQSVVTHFVLDLRPGAGDLAQPLDDGDRPRPGHGAPEADLLAHHHRGLGGGDGDGQGGQHQVQLDGGVTGEGELGVAGLARDHLVHQRPVDGGQDQAVAGDLSIATTRMS